MPATPENVRIDWDAATEGVPTFDVLEDLDFRGRTNVGEACANLVFWLEKDQFLAWERIIRREQGLLSPDGTSVAEGPDERIRYLDDFPRPDAPWYAYVRRLAQHLVLGGLRTDETYNYIFHECWRDLRDALQNNVDGLSRPADCQTLPEIVGPALWHHLQIQDAVVWTLNGIQQDDDLTLETQPWRIEDFVTFLRERTESFSHFGVTLDDLLEYVTIPEPDRDRFIEGVQDQLDITPNEPLAGPATSGDVWPACVESLRANPEETVAMEEDKEEKEASFELDRKWQPYYFSQSTRPEACPRCDNELIYRNTPLIVATRTGRKPQDSFILSGEPGFCLDCGIAAVDDQDLKRLLSRTREDWDRGEQYAVVALLDLDAVPEDQQDLPVTEMDPSPLIYLDDPWTKERAARKKRRKRTRKKNPAKRKLEEKRRARLRRQQEDD